MRVHALFLVSVVPLFGCPTDPPEPDPIEPVSASFSCTDDAGPEWRFEVGIAGPVNEGQTKVFVFTDDIPGEGGFAMTVQGTGGGSTSFVTTVPGTDDGVDPEPGDVPFSCASDGDVMVQFCASPEGRPSEVPCWACGDESMGAPPVDTEGWISCS